MKNKLAVRVYQASDEKDVISLWERSFPDDPAWNKPVDVIRNKVAFQPDWFFVCHCDSKLVGTILAGYDGVRGWLQKVAADPDYRRRGVASLLISAAERALLEVGCLKVNLQTRTGNTSAVEFYKDAGYEVEDRLSMTKHL